MVRTIFAQGTKAEAYAQWDKVAYALRDRDDRLGALIDAARPLGQNRSRERLQVVLTLSDVPKPSSTSPCRRQALC
jgi:hypothetical protein